jgi:hypothetical protein
MTTRIHLTIMQPPGYLYSQGFVDQARYARYQFRRLGAEVTLGKNRLRHDAINIIFGAHLGFDPALKQRYHCIFFNLEQLGEGGARVSQDYIELLRNSAVIDYDERNLAAYGCKPGDLPVVSFGWAPYLNPAHTLPLVERPIDLLFFGSVNQRRKDLFARIEACGWNVSTFDHPLYGQERDHFIGQAKAVLNWHFYESNRFEQTRVSHSLSLMTPVISERSKYSAPPPSYEEAVTWLKDEDVEKFFSDEFMTPDWQQRATAQIFKFTTHSDLSVWEVAYVYCQCLQDQHFIGVRPDWKPEKMNLGTQFGQDYRLGWLNVDTNTKSEPDLLLDWHERWNLPVRQTSAAQVTISLEDGQFEVIHSRINLFKDKQASATVENIVNLLKLNGKLELEFALPPTQPGREQSIQIIIKEIKEAATFCQNFWNYGCIDYRLELIQFDFLNERQQVSTPESATTANAVFCKTETTLRERAYGRAYLPDFGGIAKDDYSPLRSDPTAQLESSF